MKNSISLTLILLLASTLSQGADLTLDTCLKRARVNYPLSKQSDLIARSESYSIDNAYRGYLPQLYIVGHASYQSEVTEVPVRIPGFSFEPLSKDQYRIHAELNQMIYDGGSMGKQSTIASANAAVSKEQLEVELNKLRDRVQNLYFGILLLSEQIEQIRLKIADIDATISSVRGAVENGAALKSTLALLEAESLTARQKQIGLRSSRQSYAAMLGMLIGTQVDTTTRLIRPGDIPLSDTIRRPELPLFAAQQEAITARKELITTRYIPRISAFATGGYGRPGLDMLKNEFRPFYIVGLRLNWQLTDLYASSSEQDLLEVEQATIGVQRETFLLNTRVTMTQQRQEITTYDEMLRLDDEIVNKRSSVLASSKAQVENGTRTAHDYMRDLNDLDVARRDRSFHAIQRDLTIHMHASTTGTTGDRP
ncbi:MAG: TolC family protein [Ignavibacteria bacterium]|nr:TolC family protein [Ignavibacteria bacterium]MBK6418932.1 TolC family protein [Ignavibacteria bacterium]MBK6760379.1 TolC family protein [Ignavibacteria bacterium]MBK7186641.1 TolC family protein [Ignavibacteria bacterium]MBK7411838.1 TolC family protein [Ignavibacteria bacterium]